MAFALTHYRSYGLRPMGSVRKRAVQRVVLDITGTTADVDLDIGDDDGTFWTAAEADSTYGDLATEALAKINEVTDNATLINWACNALFDRLQAASASGSSYAVALEEQRPNITFAASNGDTAYRVTLEYELTNDQLPQAIEFGGD